MPAHHTDPSHTDTVHTTGSTVPATYSPARTPTCPTQRAAAGMARGPGACRRSDVAYTGRPHGLVPSPRPPANAKAAVAPQPPTKVWAQRRPAGMVGGMDADIRGQKYPQGVRASGTGWHQLKKLLEPDSEPDEDGVEAGLTPRQRELLRPSKELAAFVPSRSPRNKPLQLNSMSTFARVNRTDRTVLVEGIPSTAGTINAVRHALRKLGEITACDVMASSTIKGGIEEILEGASSYRALVTFRRREDASRALRPDTRLRCGADTTAEWVVYTVAQSEMAGLVAQFSKARKDAEAAAFMRDRVRQNRTLAQQFHNQMGEDTADLDEIPDDVFKDFVAGPEPVVPAAVEPKDNGAKNPPATGRGETSKKVRSSGVELPPCVSPAPAQAPRPQVGDTLAPDTSMGIVEVRSHSSHSSHAAIRLHRCGKELAANGWARWRRCTGRTWVRTATTPSQTSERRLPIAPQLPAPQACANGPMLTPVSLVRLGQMAALDAAKSQDYFSEEMLISRRDTKQAAEVTTRPTPPGSVAAHVELS